jgi:hypothetical protein
MIFNLIKIYEEKMKLEVVEDGSFKYYYKVILRMIVIKFLNAYCSK